MPPPQLITPISERFEQIAAILKAGIAPATSNGQLRQSAYRRGR